MHSGQHTSAPTFDHWCSRAVSHERSLEPCALDVRPQAPLIKCGWTLVDPLGSLVPFYSFMSAYRCLAQLQRIPMTPRGIAFATADNDRIP
jgi:hypothetical protein